MQIAGTLDHVTNPVTWVNDKSVSNAYNLDVL
jgi:hypothetical protein